MTTKPGDKIGESYILLWNNTTWPNPHTDLEWRTRYAGLFGDGSVSESDRMVLASIASAYTRLWGMTQAELIEWHRNKKGLPDV